MAVAAPKVALEVAESVPVQAPAKVIALTDVDIPTAITTTAPTAGQILSWGGTNWVPTPVRDMLPVVQAPRGEIRFITKPEWAD